MKIIIVFPPKFTVLLSDQTLFWSGSRRKVILLELTCPTEEGIQAASLRKVARYTNLIHHIKESQWEPHLMTFEVDARGFVAKSTYLLSQARSGQ